MGRIVVFYRGKGCDEARIKIAPSALPADWEEIRAAHGIEPMHDGLKFAVPIEQAGNRPNPSRSRTGPRCAPR